MVGEGGEVIAFGEFADEALVMGDGVVSLAEFAEAFGEAEQGGACVLALGVEEVEDLLVIGDGVGGVSVGFLFEEALFEELFGGGGLRLFLDGGGQSVAFEQDWVHDWGGGWRWGGDSVAAGELRVHGGSGLWGGGFCWWLGRGLALGWGGEEEEAGEVESVEGEAHGLMVLGSIRMDGRSCQGVAKSVVHGGLGRVWVIGWGLPGWGKRGCGFCGLLQSLPMGVMACYESGHAHGCGSITGGAGSAAVECLSGC